MEVLDFTVALKRMTESEIFHSWSSSAHSTVSIVCAINLVHRLIALRI